MDISAEVFEHEADAETRVKEWALEIAKDDNLTELVSLIEEKGIYDADVIQALSDKDHWFLIEYVSIG